MELRFVITTILLVLLSSTSEATIRPIVTMAAGADIITTHMNQNITLIPPFQNNYFSNNRKVDFVGGLFLGMENPVFNTMLGQLGLSYYQNNNYQIQGLVYQFADPGMGNLYYQYYIRSQRILLESKLLGTFQEKYHPFVNLGAGVAINKASQYVETPVTSSGVPMTPGYGDKTVHSFTYLIGVGVDMDVTSHIRLGGLYRYVNLGRAQLSTTPAQASTTTLKNNPLYANEIMLELSYLG